MERLLLVVKGNESAYDSGRVQLTMIRVLLTILRVQLTMIISDQLFALAGIPARENIPLIFLSTISIMHYLLK